ncbi:Ish1 domain-containing protein [Lachnospiraceae bacterium 48-33]
MIKIRVTRGGCGISYNDEHGTKRHALKTPEDGPFMCDEAQAERLVRLGVAAYVTGKAPEVPQDPDADTDPGNQEPEKATGHLDAAELESWDYNQLKKLAADMGVTPKGKKKADLIAAITAAEVEPGNDTDPDEGDGSEDDDLPELGAADPE